ncbi:MAG: TetR/AcrR family transcriptional regulator [Acidobacteria bacterium]|nr:TetR/AcrR family transcriptional regulator [Acidobacteriota bacterium]MXZ38845.1 TetR/AcrR family transcriptional regulator [Holophagales bacterium]MYF05766.1 TetR/AcrR family transcriptional regulator [Holophagales bacterium]MYJ24705.1 TetR/AcrR family transcriptional regulator [Holophagales bacterium]
MAERARTYHHGDLRASLVEEAAAMISEAGTASVTMRAIGGRLGVSRAAPYRHFPDKTALLVAVAVEGFRRLNQRLRGSGTGTSGSSVERLRHMGEQYVRFALENPAHYRLMYGREALARQDHPELREAAGALLEHLIGVIRVHQERGEIEREDPRAQAYVAWSAVHGLASLLIERQIDPNVDVNALLSQTTQTLLDGMRD